MRNTALCEACTRGCSGLLAQLRNDALELLTISCFDSTHTRVLRHDTEEGFSAEANSVWSRRHDWPRARRDGACRRARPVMAGERSPWAWPGD